MMRKELLLTIVILILLAGCKQAEEIEEPELTPEEKQEQTQEREQTPQKEVEEQPEEPAFLDECYEDMCLGYRYFKCVMQEDGCKDKVDKGITKGRCDVECVFNYDCSQDQECVAYKCEAKGTGLDLKDFPKQFLKDALIIVGAEGASTDVAAAMEIAAMLQYETQEEVPTKLDSEVAGQGAGYNLILVGTPCGNTFVEKVLGIACEGWSLKEGEAIIKLVANGDKVAMLVAGKSPSDTLRASKMVANYGSYSLEGTELIV